MLENGALSDIAPTMLTLMNMPIPPDMTGHPLVELLTEVSDATGQEAIADARG
jgi:arylsulfatase A-like enzyme